MADQINTPVEHDHVPANALVAVAGVADFWEQVCAAPHISLFLDFDGTLAPFQADRLQAFPLPGTVDALNRIIDERLASVAIVSGRPIAEITLLMGDLETTIVGAHGYEIHNPGGVKHVVSIRPEQAAILDAAYDEAFAIFDPARVERKAASVAVHFRGLDPRATSSIQDKLERQWRAASTTDLMEFRPFNGGLELRAAGRTKGTAIKELLAIAPDDSLPIYIGDDDTDEDAFAVLESCGIGIKVGPQDAVTKAAGRVPDCETVRQILIDWPNGRRCT
ncbi:MAG TPA: trehalose-phosphatase [Thermomicrobiales bacterium]|nr:trehalose-phosphatase [Thermomicrobiales bacterium]